MGSKKRIAKFFKKQAEVLESEEYTAFHKFNSIKPMNVAEEGEEENIQMVAGYKMNHPVNHGRRLRKLFKKYGKTGIDAYFNERGFVDKYQPTETIDLTKIED